VHNIFDFTKEPSKERETTPEKHGPAWGIRHVVCGSLSLTAMMKNEDFGSSEWFHA
jgi:hypothetical protein